jgi:hypothetical protein
VFARGCEHRLSPGRAVQIIAAVLRRIPSWVYRSPSSQSSRRSIAEGRTDVLGQWANAGLRRGRRCPVQWPNSFVSMGLEPGKVAQVDESWPLRSLFFLPLHYHLKRARSDGQNMSKISCGPWDKPLERVIVNPDKAHQRSIFHRRMLMRNFLANRLRFT